MLSSDWASPQDGRGRRESGSWRKFGRRHVHDLEGEVLGASNAEYERCQRCYGDSRRYCSHGLVPNGHILLNPNSPGATSSTLTVRGVHAEHINLSPCVTVCFCRQPLHPEDGHPGLFAST
jgi:hypothetical protein